MNAKFRHQRLPAALLAVLGTWSAAAISASTDISDNPLPVTSSVAPNIMFMLDSSGSMLNIVPDTPYSTSTTYVAETSCAGTEQVAGAYDTADAAGAAYSSSFVSIDIRISSGVPKIRYANTNYNHGTTTDKRCFLASKYYAARLYADSTSCGSGCAGPGNYLAAIYDGNYLNWYFGNGTLTGWADRKPGTSTRMEVAKSAAVNVLNSLDGVRLGLATYNSQTSGAGGELREIMGGMSSTKLSSMTTKINAITPSGNTPLAETLSDIGRYFATGYTGNLTLHPGQPNQSAESVNSVFNNHTIRDNTGGQSVSTAPIQYFCQKSFAVLLTDGRPQGDQSISSSLCDYAGVIGSCPTTGANAYGKKTDTTHAGHLGGTHGYESAGSDYLDDVAQALFEIDLRPDLVPSSGTKTTKSNVATYTIGFADLQASNDPLMQEAAAQGGGVFITAANSAALADAFRQATDDILAKDGAAAAVAVANAHVTTTDNASYVTSYNSGTWTGDLIAYPINTTTGVPNTNSPIWDMGCTNPTAYVDPSDTSKGVKGCSAQVLLDLKSAASRKIFTSKNTIPCSSDCGLPFLPTTAAGTAGTDKLATAQQTRLNTPSTTDGAAVVNYLRGDASGETNGTYRSRVHKLGDTVDAEPVVVREPYFSYSDNGYGTYKTSQISRTRMVYQASNEGMLHAFKASDGQEEWAYIPNLLISHVNDPASATTSILNVRTRKAGFTHYFTMDGTPVAGDADFKNTDGATGSGQDWRTILVGGFGKGGRGYYALDVTNPTAATEAVAATKVLWEFPNSVTNSAARTTAWSNLGYTFGKPIIVKTLAKGWVVLATSGYNNGTNTGDSGGDGLGHLYVINARTGDLIKDIATPNTCSATPASSPCGLAHISAYVENGGIDNTVAYVYAGDLYGNLWRFDLTGNNINGWDVALIAKLKDSSGGAQPVTSAPELAKITINGADKHFVYVGTGQYLGKTDLPCPPSPATCAWTPNSQSTQTQTMYGLVDSRTSSLHDTSDTSDPLRGHLVQQTYTTSGSTRTFSNNTIDFANKKGWYVDFSGGERISTDPALALGTLIFTTNIPDTTPCQPGGSSWIYALDYQTGKQATATLGGQFLAGALASRPVLIQLPDGTVKALTRLSDATTVTTTIRGGGTGGSGKRVSWRELFD